MQNKTYSEETLEAHKSWKNTIIFFGLESEFESRALEKYRECLRNDGFIA